MTVAGPVFSDRQVGGGVTVVVTVEVLFAGFGSAVVDGDPAVFVRDAGLRQAR